MNLAERYVEGLKKAYIDVGAKSIWDKFEAVACGASGEDIAALRTEYPGVPESLIQLLKIVDGTYWRRYAGGQVALYFLGSDVEAYPYYLLSAKQMVEKDDFSWLASYINREFGDLIPVDEKIIDDASKRNWLHFSDCMNNGGTSQLFIDFSPSDKGTKGQIVRFLHDPDELMVIAGGFEEYLTLLIDKKYDFIDAEDIDDI